jgi:PHD/YefM family antitoxin component YafN of YafNO toxin-antitoxin module
MLKMKNIHSVTDFNRRTKDYIKRLKKSGEPEVLTLNGEAQLVVQSADGYQKLLQAAELAESLAGIRRGLDEIKRGEGRNMREFLAELAAKHGVSLK